MENVFLNTQNQLVPHANHFLISYNVMSIDYLLFLKQPNGSSGYCGRGSTPHLLVALHVQSNFAARVKTF